MNKGIVYIMTTAIPGLNKIGQTGTNNFEERMRFLEKNGYSNDTGLQRYFAIEVDNYTQKESLIHELFENQRAGDSELFAVDKDKAKQLMLAFNGRVVYPENINQEEEFEEVAKVRQRGENFSFYRKGLKNGDEISFIYDEKIKAKVVSSREVEYKGQIYKLSPLAYHLFEERGTLTQSGAYQGPVYFTFNGIKLKDLPDKD